MQIKEPHEQLDFSQKKLGNCQAREPGLIYQMAKHLREKLREKLKSHRESQKGTRADAILQIPPTTHPT